MTIQEYFGDWSRVIDLREAERIMGRLVSSRQKVCPNMRDIFKAFTLCSLHDLKVVILGEDPYCNLKNHRPVATGVAFGNSRETLIKDYSPSLDVLRESVIDFSKPHGSINFDPSLEKWEAQGVLMLNSALTCQVGKTGSHALLWRPFINTFLTNLSAFDTGIVYVLMGSVAQSFEHCISPKYNYIIKTKHPSYYARNHLQMPTDLWQRINDILIRLYGFGVEWYTESNYLKEQKQNEEVFYEGNFR